MDFALSNNAKPKEMFACCLQRQQLLRRTRAQAAFASLPQNATNSNNAIETRLLACTPRIATETESLAIVSSATASSTATMTATTSDALLNSSLVIAEKEKHRTLERLSDITAMPAIDSHKATPTKTTGSRAVIKSDGILWVQTAISRPAPEDTLLEFTLATVSILNRICASDQLFRAFISRHKRSAKQRTSLAKRKEKRCAHSTFQGFAACGRDPKKFKIGGRVAGSEAVGLKTVRDDNVSAKVRRVAVVKENDLDVKANFEIPGCSESYGEEASEEETVEHEGFIGDADNEQAANMKAAEEDVTEQGRTGQETADEAAETVTGEGIGDKDLTDVAADPLVALIQRNTSSFPLHANLPATCTHAEVVAADVSTPLAEIKTEDSDCMTSLPEVFSTFVQKTTLDRIIRDTVGGSYGTRIQRP
ncbi:hypothetical protein BG004_003146 [Podila humilis]|nr:hypothetical protein BG004_003146 [Podila humilis]